MKKSKLIVLQFLIVAVLISTSVYAVSANIGASISKSTVKKGETVTATLSIKDIGSNEKIGTIEGYINYNKDIFETITVDSIQKNSDGTVTIGNENLKVEDVSNGEATSSSSFVAFNSKPITEGKDAKIVIDLSNGVSSNTDLLKIDFKLKSNVTDGQVQNAISYSNFTLYTPSGEKMAENLSQNLNLTISSTASNPGDNDDDDNKNEQQNPNQNKPVEQDKNEAKDPSGSTQDNNKNENKDTGNNNKNNNTNTNTNKNNNTNTNTNKNNNQNTNKNTNKSTNSNSAVKASDKNEGQASGVLPATGAQVVMIPIIVLIILAYVSYNRYIKYKDI